MTLIDKIKGCKTSKELDTLRTEIIQVAYDKESFKTLQSAFVKQKNKLKRNGHTPNTEGYSIIQVVLDGHKKEGL